MRRKELFAFTKERTAQNLLEQLPSKEQALLNRFKDYCLITASEKRASENLREIIRFREVTGVPLDKIQLGDVHYFLKELKTSDFADFTKNKIRSFIQYFLRWAYRDWSERFDSFRDLRINTDAQRKTAITEKDVYTREDIKKLLDAEPSLFWKTFLITQAEGGLRTGETRNLLIKDISFDDDGFVSLTVPCKKNKNGTVKTRIIPLQESANFIKALLKERKNLGVESPYLFPSPHNVNKPISKTVNDWFGKLTMRVFGKRSTNYLLRHSKGTELKKRVLENRLSKDTATEYLGHSPAMFDKTYSHVSKNSLKQFMKKEIFNSEELTENQKHKLEREIEYLKERQEAERTLHGNQIQQLTEKLEIILNKLKDQPEMLAHLAGVPEK